MLLVDVAARPKTGLQHRAPMVTRHQALDSVFAHGSLGAGTVIHCHGQLDVDSSASPSSLQEAFGLVVTDSEPVTNHGCVYVTVTMEARTVHCGLGRVTANG